MQSILKKQMNKKKENAILMNSIKGGVLSASVLKVRSCGVCRRFWQNILSVLFKRAELVLANLLQQKGQRSSKTVKKRW